MALNVAGERQAASIAAAADGDNTVVAAVADKKIRVLAYCFTVTAAGTVQWKSGGGSTLSGAMSFNANGGAAPAAPVGAFLFETVRGEALVLTNGVGVDTNGHLTYALVE